MKYGIQRLLAGITRYLWLQDAPAALSAIQSYRDVDLDVTALDPHAALQAVPAA